MKRISLVIILAALFAVSGINTSCNDHNEKFLYQDTSKYIIEIAKTKPYDYDAKIPGLDAKVYDTELPNMYQHKSQLFRDSTMCMSWDEAGFTNANRFINFFKNFQFLVKQNNKKEIAKLMQFPTRNFRTKEEFIENYDNVFFGTYRQEIVDQNPDEIFRNKFGAMIGNDGQLWFKPQGRSYLIVAMHF